MRLSNHFNSIHFLYLSIHISEKYNFNTKKLTGQNIIIVGCWKVSVVFYISKLVFVLRKILLHEDKYSFGYTG